MDQVRKGSRGSLTGPSPERGSGRGWFCLAVYAYISGPGYVSDAFFDLSFSLSDMDPYWFQNHKVNGVMPGGLMEDGMKWLQKVCVYVSQVFF